MTWQIVNSIKISISHRINVAFSYFDGGNTPHVCVSVANNPIYLIRYFTKNMLESSEIYIIIYWQIDRSIYRCIHALRNAQLQTRPKLSSIATVLEWELCVISYESFG